MPERKNVYGVEIDRFCSCGKEHEAGKASDVNFDLFATDVAAYWCPECGIKEVWQY